MHAGNFVLILHTHLPWVLHHGKSPHGEDWLNEAVAECYIPLLNVFNELYDNEGIKANATMDISPVLCEQMEHPDFKKTFIDYMDEKIAAAKEDEKNFKKWGYDEHHIYLTKFWKDWYTARKKDFIEKYDRSIIKGMKKLQDKGIIEVMTCAATHGYLPLLGYDESINLQIKAAVANYEKHFERKPRGIWLPECAYRPSYDWQSLIPVEPFHTKKLRPGIEQFLAQNGIDYFVIDEKLIKGAEPLGVYHEGNKDYFVDKDDPNFEMHPWNFDRSPLRLNEIASSKKTEYGSAAAFVRHTEIAMQVWSGDIGYPAQPDYLDFHKKHYGSNLRYWRVTDSKADMMYKTLYHPDWIWDKLDHQSMHFIHNIENTVNHYHDVSGKFATLAAPFDTELFGHWWFEGPEFIRFLIRGLHKSPYVNTATASEQYDIVKPDEVVRIPEGSWGVNNNHDVWINEDNKWTWEAIYNNENRFRHLLQSRDIKELDETEEKLLKQALRELMLLHSSDWQFLIYTQSAQDYAEQRFSFHHSDMNFLLDLLEKYRSGTKLSLDDKKHIEETEKRNSIFPELELSWFKELKFDF